MNNTVLIILFILCVLMSSFFSISEISFNSANEFKLKNNYESNNKKYGITYKIYCNFKDVISTILVGNNLVNIAASSIATIFCIRLYGESIGPQIATAAVTLIILTCGEIMPKLIGSKQSNVLIYPLSKPLNFFDIIFRPITKIVNGFVGKISHVWKNNDDTPSITDNELIDIVEEMEDNKEIDEDESLLIKNAIEFSDTTAYDIMTPRVDVISFDVNDDIIKFKTNPNLLNHSLILVYEDSIDNVLGYIDIKDIIKGLLRDETINIRDLIKDVLYVNETKKINDILFEMKKNKTHLCVVVDEFGGTYGIIKSEDILEELVGDIWDEKDKVEYEYKKISRSHYLVRGDMNIYDFFDLLEVNRDDFESEYSTVSGFVSELLEKVPAVNDFVKYKNLIIKVSKADETSALVLDVIIKKVVD